MAKEDMHGKYHKWHGIKMLILGIIVLINVYKPFIRWDVLIGILLVLMGILKISMCCSKK